MTKMKSKKMTKSTFAVIIMAILMVAMLAFGGTYAYFTAATTGTSDEAKTGRVQLTKNSTFTLIETVVPGQEILAENQTISVSPNSTVKTFVFVTFNVAFAQGSLQEGESYVTAEGGAAITPQKVASADLCVAEGNYCLTINEDNKLEDWYSFVYDNGTTSGDDATADDYTVYYRVVDKNVTTDLLVCDSIKFEGKSESSDGKKGTLMDGTITVTVDSSAIQYAGFENTADDGASYTKYATKELAAVAAYKQAVIA